MIIGVSVYLLLGVWMMGWLLSFHDYPVPFRYWSLSLLLVPFWPFIAVYMYVWERRMRVRVLKQFEDELRKEAKR